MAKKFNWTVLVVLLVVAMLPSQLFSAKSSAQLVSSPRSSMTLDFKRIAVRELLQFIAEEMNCNIIMSDSITGNISLHFRGITWEKAFDTILEMSGLVKKQSGDIVIVGTPSEFSLRQKNMEQATLVKVVKIQLHHADANQTLSLLKSQANILSPAATINVNNQDNTLWLKESVENLPMVIDFIKQSDIPDKQVLISAKVVNIDDKCINELGVRLKTSVARTAHDLHSSFPETRNNTVNFAILSFAQNQILNLELDALEKTGHSHMIADPKIITLNRHIATIEAGEEIPYQEKTASGATSVTFKKAALSLRVMPTVLPDNRIILELEINQNKISALSINGTPAIQTQELKTQIIIRNDESVMLGGIFSTENSKVIDKVPILGHVPIVGQLLNHCEHQEVKKELVILVSPHLINSCIY